jgi:hypothetical protein
MFNSAYNRKIASDIDEINRKFVTHEKFVGRGRHGGTDSAAGMTFATGAIGRSAASGKMGLGAGMSGGNFMETALGFAPLLLGLGYSSEGEDEDMGCERCGKAKCMCRMRGCGVSPKALAQLGVVEPMAKAKKPRRKAAVARLPKVMSEKMKGKGVSNYEVEDFEGSGVSGGSWLDTLSTVIEVAPLLGLGKGKKKAAAKDGRKGNKTSPWITHVKAFAAKHKMKYGEALSDPRTSASYHKK